MLQEVTLRNFKSFAHATAPIAPFTLLVGANASGKSNFVEALRFLHGLGQGWTVREALSGFVSGGVRVWDGIRGGVNDAIRSGHDAFRIDSRWQIASEGYAHNVATNGSEVLAESIGNLFEANYQPEATGGDKALLVEGLPGSEHPQTFRTSANASVMATPWGSNHWVATLRGDLRSLI
jgi:hypothetical protein